MKIAGIVAEYNPFHNGHKYHIDQVKASGVDFVIAVMSGNFVQRGDVAIFDKWTRTKAALLNGVDLVLELPTKYSTATANIFAFGAVKILDDLGCANYLSFGSETGNLAAIENAVKSLSNKELDQEIKKALQEKHTFAKARTIALENLGDFESAKILSTPNDILATEYLLALKNLKSKIKPLAVKRTGVLHDSLQTQNNIASASAIRLKIKNGDDFKSFVPDNSTDIYNQLLLENKAPFLLKNAENAILWQLRQMQKSDFENLTDISEGLNNRLYNAVRQGTSLEEILELTKTKRYTLARIRRLILHCILKEHELINPPYIKILGFNNNSTQLLNKIKETSKRPLITSYANAVSLSPTAKLAFEQESKNTDFYSLLTQNLDKCGIEMIKKIVKL